jgi:MFS family permease
MMIMKNLSTSKWLPIFIIYFQGLVQGIGFTTIPAAGNFLISPEGFHFTTEQYGSLFIPMILGAILASFFGGILAQKRSNKTLLLAAGILNTIAMGMVALSQATIHHRNLAFPFLLTSMAFMGAGFGTTITALNPCVLYFFPSKSSTALTALHACLGIGTAIGPLLLNLFISLKNWWIDPLLIALAFLILWLLTLLYLPQKMNIKLNEDLSMTQKNTHFFLLIFAVIALIYGITETTFGNWATIFLHQEKKFSQIQANHVLSVFWGSLTSGRILIAILSYKISPRYFIDSMNIALIAFSLAGVGCSAYLPLTVSFGEKYSRSHASFVSGLLISTYMLGYGISAEGIGLLRKETSITFHTVYLWLGVLVILLGLLCLFATHIKKHSRI